MKSRGALIVFEGCDRSGKTTQCRKLLAALLERNIKAELLCFPDRSTAVGKLINSYLVKESEFPDQAIHLLFSTNRWELEPRMREALTNGTTLIVDRYAFSGVAFSAAKEGMDLEWCKQPETGLPKPDSIFYLTLSAEAMARRGGFGKERYEIPEFQKKVMENFRKLQDTSWQVIDADQSVDALHQDIVSRALSVIANSRNIPLQSLWGTTTV